MINKISHKLITLLVSLSFMTIFVIVFFTDNLIQKIYEDQMQKELLHSQKVFFSFLDLEQNNIQYQIKKVASSARVNFVLENGERETIEEVAFSFREELNVPIFSFYDEDGELLTTKNESYPQDKIDVTEHLDAAAEGESAFSIKKHKGEIILLSSHFIGFEEEPKGMALLGKVIDKEFFEKIDNLSEADIHLLMDKKYKYSTMNLSNLFDMSGEFPGWDNLKYDYGVLQKPIKNKKGSVLGTVVTSISYELLYKTIVSVRMYLFWVALGMFLVIVVVGSLFSRSITKPLNIATKSLEKIAEGNLTYNLIENKGSGEIKILNDSSILVQKNLKIILQNIQNIVTPLGSESEKLGFTSSQMQLDAEQTKKQAESVASTAEQVVSSIYMMASVSKEINGEVNSVASASKEVDQNIIAVESAVKEMSTNMNQIAEKSREYSSIAQDASTKSDDAKQKMALLEKAGSEIGDVTKVIKKIAEQTNLLALNATIEAASAGVAGKGFAVVAGEIKSLADQSAKAAEHISEKIKGVQENTNIAVRVIQDVIDIIVSINESVASTAKVAIDQEETTEGILNKIAVSSQNLGQITDSISKFEFKTNELSVGTENVATDAKNILMSIKDVRSLTKNGFEEASQIDESSSKLSLLAKDLKIIIGEFKL